MIHRSDLSSDGINGQMTIFIKKKNYIILKKNV